jgi:hypothetical protein
MRQSVLESSCRSVHRRGISAGTGVPTRLGRGNARCSRIREWLFLPCMTYGSCTCQNALQFSYGFLSLAVVGALSKGSPSTSFSDQVAPECQCVAVYRVSLQAPRTLDRSL